MRASFDEVRAAARGRWGEILPALGIPTEALVNRNRPCPGCGGSDRFRFDDKDGAGTWLCGGGGELRAGDGFALLGHVRGLMPADALKAVAEYLGVEGRPEGRSEARRRARAADRAKTEAALVHELRVLESFIGARVTDRELAGRLRYRTLAPEFRPMPDGAWERERTAARRIAHGLGVLYGV